uniref:Uncharacterized protein n=1 Tax=Anolis carolinensis TaxID=28377 RepID=A0A803TIF6_ANOCA
MYTNIRANLKAIKQCIKLKKVCAYVMCRPRNPLCLPVPAAERLLLLSKRHSVAGTGRLKCFLGEHTTYTLFLERECMCSMQAQKACAPASACSRAPPLTLEEALVAVTGRSTCFLGLDAVHALSLERERVCVWRAGLESECLPVLAENLTLEEARGDDPQRLFQQVIFSGNLIKEAVLRLQWMVSMGPTMAGKGLASLDSAALGSIN